MKEREISNKIEFEQFRSCASHAQYCAYMEQTQMTDEMRASIICLLAKLSCFDLLADFINDELIRGKKDD